MKETYLTVSVSEILIDNNIFATKTYKIHRTVLTWKPENLIFKHNLVFKCINYTDVIGMHPQD